MSDPNFVQMIEHFVYVSETQLTGFAEVFPNVDAKTHVIRNAIEPIEFVSKPTDKLRLIYISTPDRGLDVLLDAWALIQPRDAELIVYSSNIIYGTSYSVGVGNKYDHLFNRCKTEQGVVYKGYAANKAIRIALQKSHILAYPSTYIETSCLAAIEAGAAGCKLITTDLGALPETCGNFAEMIPYTADKALLTRNYADLLAKTISEYSPNDTLHREQSTWFNDFYSWHTRKLEWQRFFNECAR